jgi:hypothetical protein
LERILLLDFCLVVNVWVLISFDVLNSAESWEKNVFGIVGVTTDVLFNIFFDGAEE